MLYTILVTSDFGFVAPNLTTIPSPPIIGIDPNRVPTVAHLQEFLAALQNWQVDITATTKAGICSQLHDRVVERIFGPNATNRLGSSNPIMDVYVNDSRESGDEQMWKDPGSQYAIHPVVSKNTPSPGQINLGIAQFPYPSQTPQYWVYADAVAFTP